MNKRLAVVIPFTFLFFNACTSLETESDQLTNEITPNVKKRVLILNVINRSPFGGEQLGLDTFNLIKEYFASSKEYIPIGPESVEPSGKLVSDDGHFDRKGILDKARAYGIAAIFYARIDDFNLDESRDEMGIFPSRKVNLTAYVNIQFLDARTETELLGKDVHAALEEEHLRFLASEDSKPFEPEQGRMAIKKAIDPVLQSLPRLAKRIQWLGRIAKMDRHRFYINAGQATGLAKGQILRVYDVDLTELTPKEPSQNTEGTGPFKGTLRVVDHIGQDGAIAVAQSGGGFKERDIVELYSPRAP